MKSRPARLITTIPSNQKLCLVLFRECIHEISSYYIGMITGIIFGSCLAIYVVDISQSQFPVLYRRHNLLYRFSCTLTLNILIYSSKVSPDTYMMGCFYICRKWGSSPHLQAFAVFRPVMDTCKCVYLLSKESDLYVDDIITANSLVETIT